MELHIVLNIIFLISCDTINAQSCYYTQSLPYPKFGHMAVYSNYSNSVYIFGGSVRRSTAIYKWDLNIQNSWFEDTFTSTYGIFFSYGNNAVIANNIVYFIGIQDISVASGNIYMFDIPTESWLPSSQLTKPPIPLSHGCLTTNNTHIFMVDGINDKPNQPRTPVLQIYNIATDIWKYLNLSVVSSDPGGWRNQYCSMVNNQLYILGGRIPSVSISSVYSNSIYKFDAIAETITLLSDTLPIAQSWGDAVHYDNLIYTVGSYPYTSNINVFDINTETVTNTIYEMTQRLSGPASVILNNKLYILGGQDKNLDALAEVQICDLITINNNNNNNSNQTTIILVIVSICVLVIIIIIVIFIYYLKLKNRKTVAEEGIPGKAINRVEMKQIDGAYDDKIEQQQIEGKNVNHSTRYNNMDDNKANDETHVYKEGENQI